LELRPGVRERRWDAAVSLLLRAFMEDGGADERLLELHIK
jgi:hypothetical protein